MIRWDVDWGLKPLAYGTFGNVPIAVDPHKSGDKFDFLPNGAMVVSSEVFARFQKGMNNRFGNSVYESSPGFDDPKTPLVDSIKEAEHTEMEAVEIWGLF